MTFTELAIEALCLLILVLGILLTGAVAIGVINL